MSHVRMSRQKRADDSVAQICNAIRSMAVQENPRSKLVVSFPVFRGDESEDVLDFLDNFKSSHPKWLVKRGFGNRFAFVS